MSRRQSGGAATFMAPAMIAASSAWFGSAAVSSSSCHQRSCTAASVSPAAGSGRRAAGPAHRGPGRGPRLRTASERDRRAPPGGRPTAREPGHPVRERRDGQRQPVPPAHPQQCVDRLIRCRLDGCHEQRRPGRAGRVGQQLTRQRGEPLIARSGGAGRRVSLAAQQRHPDIAGRGRDPARGRGGIQDPQCRGPGIGEQHAHHAVAVLGHQAAGAVAIQSAAAGISAAGGRLPSAAATATARAWPAAAPAATSVSASSTASMTSYTSAARNRSAHCWASLSGASAVCRRVVRSSTTKPAQLSTER